jgi:pyridoxine/pyridoxamine 5'-phosphate oxidase
MSPAEFARFVEAARMGVIATADDAGNPEAALVDLAATSSGEVIFDTQADARKVDNIAFNPRVALVIGWSEGVSVQVEGLADILSGAEREEYGRIYLERFPGSRALDEDFAVIRVVPQWMRYYDTRPESFRVAEGQWP